MISRNPLFLRRLSTLENVSILFQYIKNVLRGNSIGKQKIGHSFEARHY
jgi:hypothetical protein